MSREIRREIFLNVPPEVVWRALTEGEELARWFPLEARVQPGAGGSIWISWGSGAEAEAPITVWEPGRRLQWTEDRGPIKLAVDFHLEAKGGGTVVRLVQSGFGSGAEWDDEFHMTEAGWSYFLEHLRWYLERHRGVPRDVISFREQTSLSRTEALRRLLGRTGLSADDSLRTVRAGGEYRSTTAAGDTISGTVLVTSLETGQFGLTIAELGDAILFLEMEPAANGSRPALWLSIYGLETDRLEPIRERYGRLYRQALLDNVAAPGPEAALRDATAP